MTDKTIINARKVGGDYFNLKSLRRSPYKLDHFLKQFNPDDYWIYKTTDKQRLVIKEDLIQFKYSCYTFFKKDLYDRSIIDMWIDWLKNNDLMIKFIVKPLPPFKPSDKIEIRK